MKYTGVLICLFLFFAKISHCQNNVGIGTNTPAPDAVLELKSSNQGILVPRLSTTQRLAITNPSNGLMVYDTNYDCFYYYNAPAIKWEAMCAGPTAPTQKANVQVYYSYGDSTYISSGTPVTVHGLSISIILVDTATVMLSSNGDLFGVFASSDLNCPSEVQLYQNAIPIPGTAQTTLMTTGANAPNPNGIWSVSAVIPSLPPGVYLFELRAANSGCYGNFCAAYNANGQNQGIITAEVIY